MPKHRFHMLRQDGALTLARHLPPRWDVAGRGHLPGGRPERLAHQIRQDLWRALRMVRGFSPTVRLEPAQGGWAVTAGGRVVGPVPHSAEERIADLLNDPGHRTRWLRYAGAAG